MAHGAAAIPRCRVEIEETSNGTEEHFCTVSRWQRAARFWREASSLHNQHPRALRN
jgi:hypothetical protein